MLMGGLQAANLVVSPARGEKCEAARQQQLLGEAAYRYLTSDKAIGF
jgi:hypothetical protein